MIIENFRGYILEGTKKENLSAKKEIILGSIIKSVYNKNKFNKIHELWLNININLFKKACNHAGLHFDYIIEQTLNFRRNRYEFV